MKIPQVIFQASAIIIAALLIVLYVQFQGYTILVDNPPGKGAPAETPVTEPPVTPPAQPPSTPAETEQPVLPPILPPTMEPTKSPPPTQPEEQPVEEQPILPMGGGSTNVIIWDETTWKSPNFNPKIENESVIYYANYTNATNDPITTGDCNLTFDNGATNYSMAYNSSSYLYEYNYSSGFATATDYPYNITCDGYLDSSFTRIGNCTPTIIGGGWDIANTWPRQVCKNREVVINCSGEYYPYIMVYNGAELMFINATLRYDVDNNLQLAYLIDDQNASLYLKDSVIMSNNTSANPADWPFEFGYYIDGYNVIDNVTITRFKNSSIHYFEWYTPPLIPENPEINGLHTYFNSANLTPEGLCSGCEYGPTISVYYPAPSLKITNSEFYKVYTVINYNLQNLNITSSLVGVIDTFLNQSLYLDNVTTFYHTPGQVSFYPFRIVTKNSVVINNSRLNLYNGTNILLSNITIENTNITIPTTYSLNQPYKGVLRLERGNNTIRNVRMLNYPFIMLNLSNTITTPSSTLLENIYGNRSFIEISPKSYASIINANDVVITAYNNTNISNSNITRLEIACGATVNIYNSTFNGSLVVGNASICSSGTATLIINQSNFSIKPDTFTWDNSDQYLKLYFPVAVYNTSGLPVQGDSIIFRYPDDTYIADTTTDSNGIAIFNYTFSNTNASTLFKFFYPDKSAVKSNLTVLFEDKPIIFSIYDTAPPSIVTLSQNNIIQLNKNQAVGIQLNDTVSGVNASSVKIDYGAGNKTMNGTNPYYYYWNQTSLGTQSYTIYFADNYGNSNSTTSSFEVQDVYISLNTDAYVINSTNESFGITGSAILMLNSTTNQSLANTAINLYGVTYYCDSTSGGEIASLLFRNPNNNSVSRTAPDFLGYSWAENTTATASGIYLSNTTNSNTAMKQIFSDDFSTDTLGGANWTWDASAGYNVQNGYLNMTGTSSFYLLRTTSKSTTSEVSAWVKITSGSGENNYAGLTTRMTPDDYYSFRLYENLNKVALYKKVGGIETRIQEYFVDVSQSSWHFLEMRTNNSSIACYLDNNLLINVTDTSINTAGYNGLIKGANAGALFDDFKLKNLTAPKDETTGYFVTNAFDQGSVINWTSMSWYENFSNIAYGKTVTVTGGGNGALLVDNNLNTFWIATGGTTNFILDLGSVVPINQIIVYPFDNVPSGWPISYTVATNASGNWVNIYTNTSDIDRTNPYTPLNLQFSTTNARFIRFMASSLRNNKVEVAEIKVFNHGQEVKLQALTCSYPGGGPITEYDSNIVARWKLDGSAEDSAGHMDGASQNIVWVAGQTGQAASFSDSTTKINITNDGKLDLGGGKPFTISFWVSRTGATSQSGYRPVFLKYNGTSTNVSYGFITAQTYDYFCAGYLNYNDYFLFNTDSGMDILRFCVMGYSNTYHAVITYDPSTQTYKGYVNGVLKSSKTGAQIRSASSGNLVIGGLGPSFLYSSSFSITWPQDFIGSVDNFIIYNRTLNDSEVAQLQTCYYSAFNGPDRTNNTYYTYSDLQYVNTTSTAQAIVYKIFLNKTGSSNPVFKNITTVYDGLSTDSSGNFSYNLTLTNTINKPRLVLYVDLFKSIFSKTNSIYYLMRDYGYPGIPVTGINYTLPQYYYADPGATIKVNASIGDTFSPSCVPSTQLCELAGINYTAVALSSFSGWGYYGNVYECRNQSAPQLDKGLPTNYGGYPGVAIVYNFSGNNKWTLFGLGGFEWNGTQWESNSSLVSGLPTLSYSRPTVAYNFTGDGKWALIAGDSNGLFYGYTWNGTGWSNNQSLVGGLQVYSTVMYSSAAIAHDFPQTGNWTIFIGEYWGHVRSWIWNGTNWTDPTYITGVGQWSAPSITYNVSGNNKWTLIIGRQTSGLPAYTWNGASWNSDPNLPSGLEGMTMSAPALAYNLTGDGKWALISAIYYGQFPAFKWNGTGWARQSGPPLINAPTALGPNNGFYNITIWARDWVGKLTKYDIPLSISGDSDGDITITPSPKTVLASSDYIFNFTATLTNNGPSVMKTAWINNTLKQSGWTVTPTNYSCGEVSFVSGNNTCIKNFTVIVPTGTTNGTYNQFKWAISWKILNGTSKSKSTSNIDVIVLRSAELDNSTLNKSASINHSQSQLILLNLSSIGSYAVTNINLTYVPATLNASLVSINQTFISYICGAASSNDHEYGCDISSPLFKIIGINVTVPQYYPPGTYVGYIQINASNTVQNYTGVLNITVPTDSRWTMSMVPASGNAVLGLGESGNFANVTITNPGNVNLNFSIGYSGNLTGVSGLWNISHNPAFLYVPKGGSAKAIFNTSATSSAEVYDLNVTFTNTSGTPISNFSYFILTIKDREPYFGSIITSPSNSTYPLEHNKQFTTNIYVIDDQNSISYVYCNFTKVGTLGVTTVFANRTPYGPSGYYSCNYTPTATGLYSVIFWANDTTPNVNNTSTSQPNSTFQVYGSTSLGIATNLTNTNISSITWINSAEIPVAVNITNPNFHGGGWTGWTGGVGYNTNITANFNVLNITTETGDSWNYTPINIGDLVDKYTGTLLIHVPTGTTPGVYTGSVTPAVRWINSSNLTVPTATSYTLADTITVNVTANQLLTITESSLNSTLEHDTPFTKNFTLNSYGNVNATNIVFACQAISGAANCSTFNISFTPNNITTMQYGASRQVMISGSIPKGYAPATDYVFRIAANNSLTQDTVDYTIIVPENKTWTATPVPMKILRASDETGTVNLTVENTGNLPRIFEFVISSGNLTPVPITTIGSNTTLNPNEIYNLSLSYNTGSMSTDYYEGVLDVLTDGTPTNITVPVQFYVFKLETNITSYYIPAKVIAGNPMSAVVNLTLEGNPISTNVTFKPYVYNSFIGKVEANLTNQTYSSNLWYLNFTAPVTADGETYDLIIEAHYSAPQGLIIGTDTETGVVNYKDLTPPQISVNQNASYINVMDPLTISVAEGNPVPIKITLNDSIGGTSARALLNGTYYDLTTTSTSLNGRWNLTTWEYTSTLPTLPYGEYPIYYYGYDNENNTGTLLGYVDVYRTVFPNGDMFSNTSAGYITFLRPGTNTVLFNLSTDTVGLYNGILHDRYYDIRMFALNVTTNCSNVYWNYVNPIYFELLDTNRTGFEQAKDMYGVSIESSFNCTGQIGIYYPGELATNIENVYVYRCSNWNRFSYTCDSSWVRLSRILTNYSYVSGNVTGFSAFMATEYVPTPVQQVPGGGSGGVGGGGISGDLISMLEEILKRSKAFVVGTPSLTFELYPGEDIVTSIQIVNPGNTSTVANVYSRGSAAQFLSFDIEAAALQPSEYKKVVVAISIPINTTPGNYYGDIIVYDKTGGTTVPVNIKVIAAKAGLIDMKIQPLRTQVSPGEDIRFEINLANLGETGKVNVELVTQLFDSTTDKVVDEKIENLTLEKTLSIIRTLSVPKRSPEGNYLIRGTAYYSNLNATEQGYASVKDTPNVQRASAIAYITVLFPFYLKEFYGITVWQIAAVAGLIIVTGSILAYRRMKEIERERYKKLIDYNEIPKAGPRTIFLGNVAETSAKAFFEIDKLTTHMLVAGATGSGKTVAAQVIAEEALKLNIPVIVFDPTAQWTGFLKPNENEAMFRYYTEFGIDRGESKAFPGDITIVKSPKIDIDFKSIMSQKGIHIFVLNRLDPHDIDTFVAHTVKTIFSTRFEESPNLKCLLVYDEVHRLLKKFGGSGEGFTQIERGCREFRKWGLGLLLVSQVLSDFAGTIKANINSEIQMRTKYEDDLERVKLKYGQEVLTGIVKANVGVGMFQNPKYNLGRPYFIAFRPLFHSVTRLNDAELDMYEKYSKQLFEMEQEINKLEKARVDVFDLRLELKLAKEKLQKGAFKFIDIYMESLTTKLKSYRRVHKR